MLLSSEWPGYLQHELAKLIGDNVTVMYYNGAEGDQSPVLKSSLNGYEKAEIYGSLIAHRSFEIFKEIKTENTKEFSFRYNIIKLPEKKAHPSFMKTGGEEYGLDEKSVKIAMDMLAPDEVGLGALRIGNLVIAGVPGEMTAVLGMSIKKALRDEGIEYAAIGGLANEWIGYILSSDQYINGEGYESSVSFFGPDLGTLLTNDIIKTSLPLVHGK
jgi:hypothetical protein